MPDKPLNYRQSLFIKYYTDGDTKGNCYTSMVKAGYKKGYALKWSGCYIGDIRGIKEAIVAETALIEAERLDSRVFIDNQFKDLLAECRLKHDRVNAARVLENMAKNRGYYALDNEQKTEQAKLTEAQKEEAKRYAQWRLIQGLKEPDTVPDGQTKRTG